MTIVTTELLDEVCAQFSQDGLTFEVLALDDAAQTVDIQLGLANVDCGDCVLPAAHLQRLIEASLVKRADAHYTVVLRDPRSTASGPPAGPPQSLVEILDPIPAPRPGDRDTGPDAGALPGRTVLFRVDVLWESWDWIVEEWSAALRTAGVTVLTWRRSQGTVGETADRAQAEYDELLGRSDALICGLGNCGSCTAATVTDALRGLTLDLPTVTVVTEQFQQLAQVLAEDGGRPGLRVLALPHPLSQRPADEVRRIALDAFPQVLRVLGARV